MKDQTRWTVVVRPSGRKEAARAAVRKHVVNLSDVEIDELLKLTDAVVARGLPAAQANKLTRAFDLDSIPCYTVEEPTQESSDREPDAIALIEAELTRRGTPPVGCPRCGAVNSSTADVCRGCATRLDQPREPQASTLGPAADERACPRCGRWIKRDALKCRFCRKVLDSEVARLDLPRGVAEEIDRNARGALRLGIISIFILAPILGSMAISRGNQALRLLSEYPGYSGGMNPRRKARAGVVIAWIAIVLFVFGLLSSIFSR